MHSPTPINKRPRTCTFANAYAVLLLNMTYDDWRKQYPKDGGLEEVQNRWEVKDLAEAIIERQPQQIIFCGRTPRILLDKTFCNCLMERVRSNKTECTFILSTPTNQNCTYFKNLYQISSRTLWNEFYDATLALLKLLGLLAGSLCAVRVLYVDTVFPEDIYLLDIHSEVKTSIISRVIGDPDRPFGLHKYKGTDLIHQFTLAA